MRGSPLVKTDSKAPNQFRFIVFDGRKGVALYGVADGKLQESHWLAQFSGFWYLSGSDPAISPNGRWIYLPMHADTAVIDLQERRLRWLGRARRLSDGGYIPEVYRLRWSPNSHYLLGQRIGVDEGLILCQPLQRGYQVLVKEGVYAYGWYPDSQRIWYVQRDAGGRFRWYRLELRSGRVERLGAYEQRRVLSDWDLTLPPFRWMDVEVRRILPEWTSLLVISSTADRQVRVRVDPSDSSDSFERRLFIEWRSGRSVVVEAADDIRKMFLWDLSADYRWALVRCWGREDSRWHLVDLNRGRWKSLVFSEEVGRVLSPGAGGVIRADFKQSARLLHG